MSTPWLPGTLDAVLRGEVVAWSSLGTTASDLLELCTASEVSGLVHDRLTRSPCLRDWPDEVRRKLAAAAHAATATALVRASEVTAVLNALALAGIHPVLLKGVPLAHGVYESPGLRAHADTDLLVRRQDVEPVKQAMSPLGYFEPPLSDGELLFCQFQMAREDRLGISHVFDVHWKISTQSVFADVLTYEELSELAEPVPALGPHARAAGPVHALLLACIHPVMHHQNSERLLWQYDVHLLASRLSDAEMARFVGLAVRKEVAAICLHQLLVSRSRFGTSVSERLLAPLATLGHQEPSQVYLRAGRHWHDELISNMRGLARWRDRFRLLAEVTLPRPAYMFEVYGVSRHGRILLPALYVHRCVRGMWKVIRGRK